MASPSTAAVHVDAALSTFLASYDNSNYIADEVFPVIETEKVSGKYATYARADVNKQYDDLMHTRSRANEVNYTVSFSSYSCDMRGLGASINFATERNADAPQNVREKYVKTIMNALMLAREIRVATIMHTTGNYAAANTSAASVVWSSTTSDPVVDIHVMHAALAPGLDDTTEVVLILALEGWQALSRHPAMRGGGAQSALVTMEEAASMLGIDRIFVSKATKNTANETQTASYSRVWDKTKAVLARVSKGSYVETACFGCTFRWLDEGMPMKVRSEQRPLKGWGGSEDIVVELADDEVVVQSDNAYLLTGILS